jgi:two-component system LytT family response regulator
MRAMIPVQLTPNASSTVRSLSIAKATKNNAVQKNEQRNEQVNMWKKIALPTMEGINFENLHEVVFLEAQGNYTDIHFADGRKLLVCKTLANMEDALGEDGQFVRIHRSATINLNRIKQYVKGKSGYVIMENGQHINVSEGKKQFFMDSLKSYFGMA